MNNKIALNFLPLENQKFEIAFYRKLKNESDKKPQEAIKEYKLPIDLNNQNDWESYWISFEEKDGYEIFICESTINNYLTEMYLFWKLREISFSIYPDKIAKTENDFYSKKIHYIINQHQLGNQTIWLNPYYLDRTMEFGFLIEFDFVKKDEIPFTKEVQKLSLSLDEYFRANKNFHSDKYDFVKIFIDDYLPQIRSLDNTITISNKIKTLQVDTLATKIYRFENEEKSPSQFMGIKQFNPFKTVDGTPNYYFVFRENDIDYARDLVKALSGALYNTFDGLASMFNLDFNLGKDSSNIKRIIINAYDNENIDLVLQALEKDNNKKIAIFIFPEEMEEYYYSIKNRLLQSRIVTQGIHLETLKDENKFKWSVSSLALQIFAKLGGIPWRMKPSNNNCLIVGISQAHDKQIDSNGSIFIQKYFAYSVLMDSSGEYLSMNVLAQNENQEKYLVELGEAIKETLSKYENNYEKITLHIPYKIKHSEIEKILAAAQSIKENIELVILKISDQSKYFGYNTEHNSFIPYESSYMELSQRDFLLWTEGLNYHNKRANKHYANPLYINFYYSNKNRDEINLNNYLQDILNLTGANWRGFNAKSVPISMFYPRIISKFIKFFDKYHLETLEFEKLPPWFL